MKKLNMCPNTEKGMLITFCGLDGCGKSTMIHRIMEDYKDRLEIFLTKQPTDAVRESAVFRTYMDCPDHSEYDYRSLSLLAASDRLQHGSKVIEPAIKQGKFVLSDRYFYSCLANLRARGFSEDCWIYDVAKAIIKPDAAFFFDVPVDIAISRVRSREDEKNRYIDIDLQYRLREEYLRICKKNGGILISTDCSVDESYNMVKKEIERIVSLYERKNACCFERIEWR